MLPSRHDTIVAVIDAAPWYSRLPRTAGTRLDVDQRRGPLHEVRRCLLRMAVLRIREPSLWTHQIDWEVQVRDMRCCRPHEAVSRTIGVNWTFYNNLKRTLYHYYYHYYLFRQLKGDITCSPAGLAMLMAMINVVQKWKTSTTYQSHTYESFGLQFARFITSRSSNLPSLVRIVLAVAPARGGEIFGSRVFNYYFFVFLDTRTAYIFEPISTHSSSKDADWLKEVRSEQTCFPEFWRFGGHLLRKLPKFRRQ